jgi:hypothetical protein
MVIFVHRGPAKGILGGWRAHLLGTLEREMKEGSENGASLYMEALCRETKERTPL